MIEIRTKDADSGVHIEVCGHASTECGDAERDQVCAAVTALLVTLLAVTDGVSDNGYCSCYVSGEQLVLAEFVVSGLQLIMDGYAEHLSIVRADTRLFASPETGKWSKLKIADLGLRL